MIRKPEFKVGDLVVYINRDYDQSRARDWWHPDHVPPGSPCKVVEKRAGLEGWELVRLNQDLTTMYPIVQWYALPKDIHPLFDDPYEEAK